MAVLIQKFLHGLMYLVVLPLLIVVLVIYSVIGVVMFVFIGIKAIVMYFTGRNIFGELPEDIRAREILEQREAEKNQPPVIEPAQPVAPPVNEVQPQVNNNPAPQNQVPPNGYPPYPGYPYPPYPGYGYPPYPGYPYPPQPNNVPNNNAPIEEENTSHESDILEEPAEVKPEDNGLERARYDGGDDDK